MLFEKDDVTRLSEPAIEVNEFKNKEGNDFPKSNYVSYFLHQNQPAGKTSENGAFFPIISKKHIVSP